MHDFPDVKVFEFLEQVGTLRCRTLLRLSRAAVFLRRSPRSSLRCFSFSTVAPMIRMWLYLSNNLVRCVAGCCLYFAAVKGGSVSEEVLSFIYMTSSLATKETIERSKKKEKKSASRESCLTRDSGSYCARVAYTNEVALVAGSLNGMTTQSIAPIGRIDAEGYSLHRRPQVISECAEPNDGSEPCSPGVKVPAAPHLAGTCMSLSSTSSGLPGEPATESHTSVSATMTYDECYNVCNENATIYSALQGDTPRWLARTRGEQHVKVNCDLF